MKRQFLILIFIFSAISLYPTVPPEGIKEGDVIPFPSIHQIESEKYSKIEMKEITCPLNYSIKEEDWLSENKGKEESLQKEIFGLYCLTGL